MIEKAEDLIPHLGLSSFVYACKRTARIETLPEDFPILLQDDNRNRIITEFKSFGFKYISLDLQGYRTGSLNEVLSSKKDN
jgi:ATP-utilizing enzymes of the PP-loop superfamily